MKFTLTGGGDGLRIIWELGAYKGIRQIHGGREASQQWLATMDEWTLHVQKQSTSEYRWLWTLLVWEGCCTSHVCRLPGSNCLATVGSRLLDFGFIQQNNFSCALAKWNGLLRLPVCMHMCALTDRTCGTLTSASLLTAYRERGKSWARMAAGKKCCYAVFVPMSS